VLRIKYLKYLILLVAAIFLVMFLYQIDFQDLRRDVDKMGIRVIWMLLISFMAYLLSTLGWMLCMHAAFDLSKLKAFFLARQLGETLGTLNPTGIVGGDALRVLLIGKAGIGKNLALPSVITSRGLLWLSYLLVALLGMILFMIIYQATQWPMFVMCTVLILCFILLGRLLFKRGALNSLAVGIVRLSRNNSWMKRAEGFQKYNDIISRLWVDRRQQVFLAIVCFSLHYACGAWEFQYILSSLDVDMSFSSAMILEVGTSLVRAVMTVVPGQVGIEEYSNKYFLQQLGVADDTVWISVSLIRRFRQLFWILLSVIIYFVWYHKDLKNGYGDLDSDGKSR